MKNFLVNLGVYIVALLLLPIALILGGITALFIPNLSEYLRNVAFSLDMSGGVILAPLLNIIAITDKGYAFGDRYRTISFILAVNREMKTLKAFGRFLVWIINKADISQEDHFDNALELNKWKIVYYK